MDTVTVRDLRNHGAEVLERVVRGTALIVTRDGRPVAELRPLGAKSLTSAELLDRWRAVPRVDAAALRRDLDQLLDSTL